MMFWVWIQDLLSEKTSLILITVTLVFGYLLKDSFVLIFPIILIGLYFIKKISIKNTAIVSIPFFMIVLLWKFQTLKYTNAVPLASEVPFLELWASRKAAIFELFNQFYKLFTYQENPILLFILAGFCFLKNEKIVARLVLIYIAITILAFGYLYLVMFVSR